MKQAPVRNWISTIVLSAALALSAPFSAAAQQATLTLDQARVLANQALAAGDMQVARAVALGLLQANENDFFALMTAATAEVALGDFKSAAKHAAKAYRNAPNKQAKVSAARLAASARFRQKQYFNAEYWLRAARQNVTTPEMAQSVSQEFQAVRRENPVTMSFNFSVAPNSNINNGSEAEFITLFGLPFALSADARALSGIETSYGFDIGYRLSENQNHKTVVGLIGSNRTYQLSSAAAAAAPDVSGSDYAFGALELYLRHNWLHNAANGPASASLHLGRNWYGGDPYTYYSRLTVGQEFRFGNGAVMNLGARIQRQVDETSSVETQTYGLSTDFAAPATEFGQFRYGLGIERTGSQTDTSRNRAVRANLGYSFAKPILGANISANVTVEKRDWEVASFSADGRHDVSVTSTLNIGLPFSYFGFSPLLQIESRKSNSNISLYQRQSLGMRVGIQTRF